MPSYASAGSWKLETIDLGAHGDSAMYNSHFEPDKFAAGLGFHCLLETHLNIDYAGTAFDTANLPTKMYKYFAKLLGGVFEHLPTSG